MPVMEDIVIRRIKARMEEKRTNATRLAIDAGLGKTAVRDILAGKSRSPSLDTLTRIAKVLECSVSHLIADFEDQHAVSVEIGTPDIELRRVSSMLAAGVFRSDNLDTTADRYYPVYSHPLFNEHRLELYQMADSSMKAIGILPGDMITTATRFDEIEIDLVDGLLVVVARTINSYELTEVSARRVRVRATSVELHTAPLRDEPEVITLVDRSGSPGGQNLYLSGGESDITILGIIVRVTREFPKLDKSISVS